jgi:ribosome-binding factor A
MSLQRLKKVESLLIREVSEILLTEVKDPRVRDVTITGAKVSADLSHAIFFYQCHAVGADLEAVAKGLDNVRKVVRKLLGMRVRLKFLPEIKFEYDPSLEYGERIEKLLQQVKTSSADDGDSDTDDSTNSNGAE